MNAEAAAEVHRTIEFAPYTFPEPGLDGGGYVLWLVVVWYALVWARATYRWVTRRTAVWEAHRG